MADDPPVDDNRTVFMPVPREGSASQPGGPGPALPASAPPEPPGWDVLPTTPHPLEPPSEAAPPEPTPAPPPQPTSAPPTSVPELTGFSAVAAANAGRVEVGAVLNNIFQVTRFLARGGMGEVFEGINVNTEERVAIKVMLPALAADPNVQAMFRKEARTLTRLHHPAVVQYRVLAQEPRLGVFYIVTEFIDGAALSDLMSGLSPTAADLRVLTRRLAEGLGAAHRLGAVHRDISPDNVLLPGRALDQAKIIDFGIAKDLDPSKATIVGDGFAGKLGYVAPEQFGDFGREVGPWTDVYSLGLVILATALGRDVDMGATLVEAIDKRRAGLDLSPVPADLRPVLERMLAADPARRFRSMDEVIAALDAGPSAATRFAPAPTARPEPAAGAPTTPAAPTTPSPAGGVARKGPPVALIAGGGVAALVAVGVLAVLLTRHPAAPTTPAAGSAGAPPASASDQSKVEVARKAVSAAFASIPCAWLDLTNVADSGGGVGVRLAGVAGSPAQVQSAVSRAGSGAGAPLSEVNLDDVAPVDQAVCAPLDAFRGFRNDTSSGGQHIASQQVRYQLHKQANGTMSVGAVINLTIPAATKDFDLLGLDPNGDITVIERPSFMSFIGKTVEDQGGGNYRLKLDTTGAGWKGVMLLTATSLAGADLLSKPPADRGADWGAKVAAAAAAGAWKAEMVWYKVEGG